MPSADSPALQGSDVSLLGKLPAQPDFVRIHYSGRAAAELDQWLVQAVEQLHLGKVELSAPVRFAFCAARAQNVLFGVLAPSRDQGGRSFPVAVFDSLPLAAVLGRLAACMIAHEPFMGGAEAVIREAQALPPGAALGGPLEGLHAPDAAALATVQTALEGNLRAASAAQFLERAFGPFEQGMHFYACFALLTAAAPVRAQAPDKPGTVLDCGLRDAFDRAALVELVTRVLSRWRTAVPSCFWVEQPEPRLLLSLGPPPADVLRALADADYRPARLWPLVTGRVAAIERARTALEPAMAGSSTAGESLDALLDALGRASLP